MIKIAICDDDEIFCNQIESFIKIYELSIMEKFKVECFLSGEKLYQTLMNNNYYDIIFLDIELKVLNGVEVGKLIREEMHNETTQIVYVSSKENYAMQLFKVRPLDFILKPINYNRIASLLKIALSIIKNNDTFYLYKKNQASFKVPIKEIMYFESVNRKVNIFTINGIDTFYDTLETISKKLPFLINIHKSYLVNYNYVIKMEYNQLTMSNNMVLPISLNNRKQVRDKLLQLEWETNNFE